MVTVAGLFKRNSGGLASGAVVYPNGQRRPRGPARYAASGRVRRSHSAAATPAAPQAKKNAIIGP